MIDADTPAIVVDDVVKRFQVPGERVMTLKERALHPLRSTPRHELTAVDHVSFSVTPAEFFAVVGRNGSGKSTLLKCLAGIYAVDGGRMFANGRMSTFIELGVGFNMELPARENVIINATMLGLSPRDARERLDAVLEFAELEEFADLRLKNYSSGMLVRLAFAVMIQVDADILLIDEVLAVGDAAFQQKCYDEFARLRQEGRTVVLVTHDMAAVERFCDRALLLEHGRPVMMGDPHEVGLRYMELNFARERTDAEQEAAPRVGPLRRRSGGDPRGLVRGRRRAAGGGAAQPGALLVRGPGALQRGRAGPDPRLRAPERRPADGAGRLHALARPRARLVPGGRGGDDADRVRQPVPARPLLRHARDRPRRHGLRLDRSARAPHRAGGDRAARGPTRSSTCPAT